MVDKSGIRTTIIVFVNVSCFIIFKCYFPVNNCKQRKSLSEMRRIASPNIFSLCQLLFLTLFILANFLITVKFELFRL